MGIFSVSAARVGGGEAMCAMDEASGALIHAADKYSRGLGGRPAGPASARTAGRAQPYSARSERERSGGSETLPEGYVLVREVRDLTLLGFWPLLEDGMSPCLPTRIIAAMQRRSSLGDHDADAWLKMHAQACTGDPEAQRALGRACENGSYRVAADLQRAFFWYYRAGLQGDAEALRNAERLMHRSQRISPATMGEPSLIYPGQWRIMAHLSGHLCSASVFDLDDDGTATGRLLGNSRAAAGIPSAEPDAREDPAALPSRANDIGYRGGWAYDGIGQVLTIIFESDSGERRWRSATWQIELLGCKPGSIFGRDRRRVGYTLERLSGAES